MFQSTREVGLDLSFRELGLEVLGTLFGVTEKKEGPWVGITRRAGTLNWKKSIRF